MIFLGLDYLTQDDIFQFHQFACKFCDVIVLNSWVIFHCIYERHFLYPFFSWVTCFQFLTITNKTAINIVENCICCTVEHHLGLFLGEVYLGLGVELFPVFCQIWFPMWLYKFVLTPAMEECSPCSISLPAYAVAWVFDLNLSDKCKMESQDHLDLHFLDE